MKKDGASSVSGHGPPPVISQAQSNMDDAEEKIREYLIFQNFLKKNTAGSTDLTVLRKMIRKYAEIL